MNLMTTWQARWRSLAASEQRWLLLVMVVLGAALLWWLALAPALAVLKAAPAQHRALDAQLQQMQQLQAQAQSLQSQPALTTEDARSALEASLKPLGATAQMAVQADRITVTFKGMGADALARWLATARQNARTAPSEAHLVRNAALTWDGAVVINLGARP